MALFVVLVMASFNYAVWMIREHARNDAEWKKTVGEWQAECDCDEGEMLGLGFNIVMLGDQPLYPVAYKQVSRSGFTIQHEITGHRLAVTRVDEQTIEVESGGVTQTYRRLAQAGRLTTRPQ